MKILALGGSGDMGRMAVAILLESPDITSITVADKNFEKTKHFIDLVGSDKLEAVELDVTKQNKLTSLISSYDLVINTVGPFYKYGTMI
ncbi:MAG: saccharopine dehydrogenase NADP-binding domain-containing protein, partial [Promethearchaeota archaeon]